MEGGQENAFDQAVLGDLRRVVLERRATALAAERQSEEARENLRQAEDTLRAAEEEAQAIERLKTFVTKDLHEECFVCMDKFSESAGTTNFNVV